MSRQPLFEDGADTCPECDADPHDQVASQLPGADYECLRCGSHYATRALGLDAEEIRDRLRSATDEVVTPSSSTEPRFHLPASDDGDGEIRCRFDQKTASTKRSPLSVYPEGWRPWCRYCAALLLDDQLSRDVSYGHIPDMEVGK